MVPRRRRLVSVNFVRYRSISPLLAGIVKQSICPFWACKNLSVSLSDDDVDCDGGGFIEISDDIMM